MNVNDLLTDAVLKLNRAEREICTPSQNELNDAVWLLLVAVGHLTTHPVLSLGSEACFEDSVLCTATKVAGVDDL